MSECVVCHLSFMDERPAIAATLGLTNVYSLGVALVLAFGASRSLRDVCAAHVIEIEGWRETMGQARRSGLTTSCRCCRLDAMDPRIVARIGLRLAYVLGIAEAMAHEALRGAVLPFACAEHAEGITKMAEDYRRAGGNC